MDVVTLTRETKIYVFVTFNRIFANPCWPTVLPKNNMEKSTIMTGPKVITSVKRIGAAQPSFYVKERQA